MGELGEFIRHEGDGYNNIDVVLDRLDVMTQARSFEELFFPSKREDLDSIASLDIEDVLRLAHDFMWALSGNHNHAFESASRKQRTSDFSKYIAYPIEDHPEVQVVCTEFNNLFALTVYLLTSAVNPELHKQFMIDSINCKITPGIPIEFQTYWPRSESIPWN